MPHMNHKGTDQPAVLSYMRLCLYEPWHDKTNKVNVHPAKTQISLGVRPDWSESSLCAQRVARDPSFLHADSEDSGQTGLIWVFAGCTVTLLVLSCRYLHVCYLDTIIQLSRLMTKPTKCHVHSAVTQISLGIHPILSESSLSAWRKPGSLPTHWAHSEDSDQTGQIPRLIWVLLGAQSFCWLCHEAAQLLPLCEVNMRICSSEGGNIAQGLWRQVFSWCGSNEPRYDKTNKMSVRPAKTQNSLGICPVWSESSMCTQWVAKNPRFLHADSEDSDQTGRMPRLIWVFAGHMDVWLVLSWGISNVTCLFIRRNFR